MKKNILVTGCGSDIGQSIGHILKKWEHTGKLIGTDINGENASKFIYDHFILVPRCHDTNYNSALKKIIDEFAIDLIIVGTEYELRMITEMNIEGNYFGLPLVAVDLETRKISFDKFKTGTFLKEHRLPHPFIFPITDHKKIEKFPVILKSRYGASGKLVELIETEEQLLTNPHLNDPEYFLQEYLPGEKNEYTCCVYRDSSGNMLDIIFRRKLLEGFSFYGEVEHNNIISEFIKKIASEMNVTGSINLQLRLVNDTPMLFEINPRFSSTVEFRHDFGFKDLIWSLEDKLGIKGEERNIDSKWKYSKFYKAYTVFYE